MSSKKRKKKFKERLIKKVHDVFRGNPGQAYNYKNVAHQLQIEDNATKELVNQAFEELTAQQKIVKVQKAKYQLNAKENVMIGIVDMKQSGSAFIIVEGQELDIFIPDRYTGKALNGDTVKVSVYKRKGNKKPEGKIIEVIERKQMTFVGTLQLSTNFAFLVSDKRNMPVDIFIPKLDLSKVNNGDKAVVKITDWPEKAKNPIGKLVQVLGKKGDNNVEMQSILVDKGFSLKFSKEVEKELNGIQDNITEGEIANRRDIRNITTFTIDPVDAKDFDDALSVQKLDNGNWEVGVHIADVSHYIQHGSHLDKEAFKRGTSVYLVDRVLPMLPEKISNEICSLRPQEEKLCFSAIFELDNNANITKEWFGKTVIYSDKRFTYEQAYKALESTEGEFSKEIAILNTLSKGLKKKRFDEGAISFETIEVQFDIDSEGVPLGVFVKERNDAHFLIEEFMLLANKRVAEFMSGVRDKSKPKQFIYRIHDTPNMDKIADFKRFAASFDYKLNIDTVQQISASLNKLMEEVKGKPEQNILEQMAIRTMSKAVYSSKNIGHYGLAFKHYTHFTSPIRRYPDIIAHRLLEQILTKKQPGNLKGLEEDCEHLSQMEANALQAERDSTKYKQVEYLEQHKGKVFKGVISGMIERGLFVELLDNKCEGMVQLSSIEGDYYKLDERNFCVVGKTYRKKYHLGDMVRVIVAKTDLSARTIDFLLVEDD